MELLGKLGIDLYLFVAQVVNFIVLLYFLNRFVYRPVLKKIKMEKTELEEMNDTKLAIES